MKLESPYPHEERLAKRLAVGRCLDIYKWHEEAKEELQRECSSVYVEVVVWQTDGLYCKFYTQVFNVFAFVDSFPRNWTVEIYLVNKGENA